MGAEEVDKQEDRRPQWFGMWDHLRHF